MRFDLVYITAAHFPLFYLGLPWNELSGTPYVLDYHDPWVRDRPARRTTQHTLKLRVVNQLARWMERHVTARAAGIVSVSPVYLDECAIAMGVYRVDAIGAVHLCVVGKAASGLTTARFAGQTVLRKCQAWAPC